MFQKFFTAEIMGWTSGFLEVKETVRIDPR